MRVFLLFMLGMMRGVQGNDSLTEPVGETKYSWYCRNCDMLGYADPFYAYRDGLKTCHEEASLNGEVYGLNNCTGLQMCEVLSQTDPNEGAKYREFFTPGWVVNIYWERYCCDKHDICGLRMGDYAKRTCGPDNPNGKGVEEKLRRTCCKLEGLACDEPIRLGDIFQHCLVETPCEERSRLIHCCVTDNLKCDVPSCEQPDPCVPSPGNAEGQCLSALDYGYCCEFHQLCEGALCPNM